MSIAVPIAEARQVVTEFQERLRWREGWIGVLPTEKLIDEESRRIQYARLAHFIGNTPLTLAETVGESVIIAKWESLNPSESHYDRAYFAILNWLEQAGVIRPGDELREITSGSAGTSFAWLCSRLGFKARVIVPPELPAGRIQEMMNFGAEVMHSVPVATSAEETRYVKEASDVQRKEIETFLAEGYVQTVYRVRTGWTEPSYKKDQIYVPVLEKGSHRVVFVNHSGYLLTPGTFESIVSEVHKVIGDTVTHAVSILGNWTTTQGLVNGFRHHDSSVKVIGVESSAQPVYFAEKHPEAFERLRTEHPDLFSRIELFGASQRGVPICFADPEILEEIRLVDRPTFEVSTATWNASKTGVERIGKSSGASLVAARQVAAENPGSVVLVLFYDNIDRYAEPHVVTDRTEFDPLGHFTRPLVSASIRLPQPSWEQAPTPPKDLPRDLYSLGASVVPPECTHFSLSSGWALTR